MLVSTLHLHTLRWTEEGQVGDMMGLGLWGGSRNQVLGRSLKSGFGEDSKIGFTETGRKTGFHISPPMGVLRY